MVRDHTLSNREKGSLEGDAEFNLIYLKFFKYNMHSIWSNVRLKPCNVLTRYKVYWFKKFYIEIIDDVSCTCENDFYEWL